MIHINDNVEIKQGYNAGKVGKVTTIITTNRKRYFVTFQDGYVTSYFYRHLRKSKNV